VHKIGSDHVDKAPGSQEAHGDFPVEVVGRVDVVRDLERLAVPKVLRGTARLFF
jgi:hypothetical protein